MTNEQAAFEKWWKDEGHGLPGNWIAQDSLARSAFRAGSAWQAAQASVQPEPVAPDIVGYASPRDRELFDKGWADTLPVYRHRQSIGPDEGIALTLYAAQPLTQPAGWAWLEKLFERKWNGVVDSGSRFDWTLRGDWRHYIKDMEGETFIAAINRAMLSALPKSQEVRR